MIGGATTLLSIPPLLLLRRRRERADRLEGRRAGKRGPCAAQGIPEVAAIDTTARQPELAT
jgi:hypothetical protein